MKIRSVKYPTPLSEIKDIKNDNIDIIIETDDGIKYTFVVMTPSNFYWYMDKEGLDYFPASPPPIVVRELSEKNILSAVESLLVDNGYWLKLYFLAGQRDGVFSIESMNKMIYENRMENDNPYID